jgi:Bacterial pre-peptidase C-terminal domain
MIDVVGKELQGLRGLFATGSGITAEVVDAGKSDAKSKRLLQVTIAADAPLGIQELRVYDATGASNPRFFQVGEWPEAREAEPNGTREAANRISLPATVNGQIGQDGDADCYTFAARAGERIACEIYSMRLIGNIGDSWLKGYMELSDKGGHVLAANEGYYHWDPYIEFQAPADGDYTLLFRELSYRGAAEAVYRLTVGAVPHVAGILPAGGRRGTTVEVRFAGINLGDAPTQRVTIPADAPLDSRDVRLTVNGHESNPVPFVVGDLPETVEQEPNNTRETANTVSPPVTINGRIDAPGDVDCYRFHAEKGQRLVMEVMARRADSLLDSYLTLRDPSGSVLSENDDGRDRDSRMDRTFDAAGDYTLEIRDVDERGGGAFTYRLTLGPPRANFRLTATPDKPFLGAGGTAILDIALDRQDGFDGEVTVSVPSPPPGVAATTAVIPKDKKAAQIAVTVADGVGVGPRAISVVGEATIDGRREQRTAQTTEIYNIQGTAFNRELTGPILAVGDPAPLTLSLGTPSVTMPGGATAATRVTVTRRGDAKGPVTVTVAGLPAGVTAEPLTIPENASEGMLVLKAAPEATGATGNLLVTAKLKSGKNELQALAPFVSISLLETPGFILAVEPKQLSLPRGGQVELRVKATRRGGFDEPIDVQLTDLPAGVTADAARIEPGQTEVKILLHAPMTMAKAKGDVKLTARATLAGLPVTREAPPISLAVTDPS